MSSIPPATALPSRRTLVCALVAILSPAVTSAAENGLDDAKTLDRVVVTATPVQPLTFETDPRLPRQPVPASDGADYLKTIPGFSALRNGGTNGDPVLRGMSGSRLNLLSNDGSMPGACPARMDNPMSYVAPETYDSLIVVKGPQTVLWGPGASAGTVRFQRQTAPFDSRGLRLQGSVLGASFDRNDQVMDATAGTPAGYARLTANRSESGDYTDGHGDVVPSKWKKWNADLALGWTPSEDTLVELTAGNGNGKARYAGRAMDGAQFMRESVALRFERSLQGSLRKLQASLYRNDADHVMDNYTLRAPNPMSAMPMPVAANVDRSTEGGRFAMDWEWRTLALTAGMDLQDSRHRERSAMGVGAYATMPWTDDAEFRNTGLFAEAKWTLQAGNRVVAGARVDRARVTDLRAGAGMMGLPNPTYLQTRRETLPAGFARYEHDIAGTGLGWYAGLGHTARMPDYWELISPDTGPMGSPNAFAGIRPEKTTQADVGMQFRAGQLNAWLSAYAGRIDDYVLFSYLSGGMMGMKSAAANVDARIHGAEAGLEFRPAVDWTIGGDVAWAWGRNATSGTPLPQMTPLEGRFTAAWDNGRWSLGALVRAVARQERVAVDQGNVVGRDLGPSPGFVTVAINGGVRLSDRVQLTAGIDNLFDRAYSEHLNLAGSADFGYPAYPVRINEPGRSAWLKLNYAY